MRLIDNMLVTHFEKRKLKKLEARRQEYIRASKEIMIGITKELIYHNIEFKYLLNQIGKSILLNWGDSCLELGCYMNDKIDIRFNGFTIAIYQQLTWFQHFNLWRKQFKICKNSSITKRYYFTDEAIRALRTMIITGVKL